MSRHDILILEGAPRLAKGSERAIYAMPGDPDRLIKVMLPKYRRALDGLDPDSGAYRRKARLAYALFHREARSADRAIQMSLKKGGRPPLPKIHGLRETDQGLGQVVERISTLSGEMAPTLADQVAAGPLDEAQQAALDAFVSALFKFHIVVHDAGPKNIVWDAFQSRYVLVDGFGDRSAIPLKSWIKPLNDRRLDKAFSECAKKAGLRWDRKARRLSP